MSETEASEIVRASAVLVDCFKAFLPAKVEGAFCTNADVEVEEESTASRARVDNFAMI